MGYIDTMPLIFIVLGFIIFLFLKAIDLIDYLLFKLFKSKNLLVAFHIVLLLLLLYILSHIRLIPWHPSGMTSTMLRNILVIVPVTIGVYWINKSVLKHDQFWKNQLMIFSLIFFGGNALLWIGNKIGYLIDKGQFEKIIHKPYFCTYDSLAIGLLMAFSIGLILNNLTKTISSSNQENTTN